MGRGRGLPVRVDDSPAPYGPRSGGSTQDPGDRAKAGGSTRCGAGPIACLVSPATWPSLTADREPDETSRCLRLEATDRAVYRERSDRCLCRAALRDGLHDIGRGPKRLPIEGFSFPTMGNQEAGTGATLGKSRSAPAPHGLHPDYPGPASLTRDAVPQRSRLSDPKGHA